MKYKVGDIVIGRNFKVKIIKVFDYNYYKIERLSGNIILYKIQDIEDLDVKSELDIKSTRKEKLNKLYDTSAMVE